MESPIRSLLPARLGLLQAAAGRVDSVASTGPPGSTRTGQGTVVARNWLKGDKHLMSKELAIPYRDLRLLDPEVPEGHPSAIFIREKALVIHLESTRMVIAKDAVYILTVPSAMDRQMGVLPTADAPLVKDLVLRLSSGTEAAASPALARPDRNAHINMALPYELRALESALHVAVAALEDDTLDLEHSIGASLDNLDQRISRRELENIQQGKGKITRLHTKLSRLTQVLEDILDDDADMADMYLARRAQMTATAAAANATQQGDEPDRSASTTGRPGATAMPNQNTVPKDDFMMQNQMPAQAEAQSSAADSDRFSQLRRRRTSNAGGTGRGVFDRASNTSESGTGFWGEAPTLNWTKANNLSLVRSHHIEACESLLETYFMQADYALSRLVTLKERTEATESLAKMHLAQRRNELVSFDLMLTVISINIAFVGGVASLCGMNLWLAGSNAPSESFVICVVLSLVLSTGIMCGVFAYARYHQLLLIPSAP
ncbi:MAG: hypothetical protein FRX49_06450 [Trebouxia sp. A1-2]|nr:MAG: hypothetical protein FRX49_06450 [Trebouxia sp. A1-2]